MSVTFKKKITLSRQEATERVLAIGQTLSVGGDVTFEVDGETVAASLPDTSPSNSRSRTPS